MWHSTDTGVSVENDAVNFDDTPQEGTTLPPLTPPPQEVTTLPPLPPVPQEGTTLPPLTTFQPATLSYESRNNFNFDQNSSPFSKLITTNTCVFNQKTVFYYLTHSFHVNNPLNSLGRWKEFSKAFSISLRLLTQLITRNVR